MILAVTTILTPAALAPRYGRQSGARGRGDEAVRLA